MSDSKMRDALITGALSASRNGLVPGTTNWADHMSAWISSAQQSAELVAEVIEAYEVMGHGWNELRKFARWHVDLPVGTKLYTATSPSPEQREKVELTDAVLVPKAPTEAMIDRAVAMMLCVKIGGNYSWTQYARDLWTTMLAGSCLEVAENRTRPETHVEEIEKSEHDVLTDEQMFEAWVSGGGWQADFDSRAMRAVLAAYEAKQKGVGNEQADSIVR